MNASSRSSSTTIIKLDLAEPDFVVPGRCVPRRRPKGTRLKPGMRVDILVEGKGARITPAPRKNTAKLSEIQAILKYSGPRVPVKDMRVTDYRGLTARGP